MIWNINVLTQIREEMLASAAINTQNMDSTLEIKCYAVPRFVKIDMCNVIDNSHSEEMCHLYS